MVRIFKELQSNHFIMSKKPIRKKFYRLSDIPMIPRKEVVRPLKRLRREYEVLFS